MYESAKFLIAGDRALCVELGDEISPSIHHRVRSLSMSIERRMIEGITEVIPTYRSILVCYDPMLINPSELEMQIRALENKLTEELPNAPRVVEVPVVYGGVFGPDIEHVASNCGISAEDVTRIHSGADYLIYMMGFTIGFAYLYGMSNDIATPRLNVPRVAVPAGSVGIAETQTGLYSTESPGGWQLIGRTPLKLFDAQLDPPVIVGTGDHVKFIRITEGEYWDIQRQIQLNNYTINSKLVR